MEQCITVECVDRERFFFQIKKITTCLKPQICIKVKGREVLTTTL